MKLLVVEDDKTVGQYVKRGLEEQQYIEIGRAHV